MLKRNLFANARFNALKDQDGTERNGTARNETAERHVTVFA